MLYTQHTGFSFLYQSHFENQYFLGKCGKKKTKVERTRHSELLRMWSSRPVVTKGTAGNEEGIGRIHTQNQDSGAHRCPESHRLGTRGLVSCFPWWALPEPDSWVCEWKLSSLHTGHSPLPYPQPAKDILVLTKQVNISMSLPTQHGINKIRGAVHTADSQRLPQGPWTEGQRVTALEPHG